MKCFGKERKKVIKNLKTEFENDDDKLESIKRTMWPFRIGMI